MSYQWIFTDAAQAPVSNAELPDTQFPTQADAEAWLAQEWATLPDLGVAAVTLTHHDSPVYGPMSLES